MEQKNIFSKPHQIRQPTLDNSKNRCAIIHTLWNWSGLTPRDMSQSQPAAVSCARRIRFSPCGDCYCLSPVNRLALAALDFGTSPTFNPNLEEGIEKRKCIMETNSILLRRIALRESERPMSGRFIPRSLPKAGNRRDQTAAGIRFIRFRTTRSAPPTTTPGIFTNAAAGG